MTSTPPRSATRALAAAVVGAASFSVPASAAGGPATGDTPSVERGIVFAAPSGVVRRSAGSDTTYTTRSASVAHGVDGVVVFAPGAGQRGRTPRLRVATPDGVSVLGRGRGVDQQQLLGAGVRGGRPVALVGETRDADDPRRSRDALVAIDLVDGARTVFARRVPSWEARYQQAHLLPGGDVVALRQESVTQVLSREAPGRTSPVWATRVATDRSSSLAALGRRLSVVSSDFAGDAVRFRIKRYRAGDGQPVSRRWVRAPGLYETAACLDWRDGRTLLCSGEHGAHAVTAAGPRQGAARYLRGPFAATATALGGR